MFFVDMNACRLIEKVLGDFLGCDWFFSDGWMIVFGRIGYRYGHCMNVMPMHSAPNEEDNII